MTPMIPLSPIVAVGRAIWRFLQNPLGQLACTILIFGSLAWWHAEGRYRDGVKAERGRWEARQEADARAARAKEAKNAEAAQQASERVETVREVVRWRTKTIVEQIPYAVPTDPSRPGLGWGFVRLHDEAAVGVSSASDRAGEPDDAISPVTDAQALGVIVENYGACRFDQERLAELQALLKTWGMAK